MIGKIFLTLLLALWGIFWCAAGFCEDQASAPEEQWDPSSAGPVTTWTSPLCAKGKLIVQPFFFYHHTRGTFDADGHSNALPAGDQKEQFQQQLFVQYGLTDRLEIDGQVTYQQTHVRQGGNSAHDQGWGDSYFYSRYCLLAEQKFLPHTTAIFQLLAPTGKFQKGDSAKLGTDLNGGGTYDPGYGLILTKRLKPFVLHADAIYNFPIARKIDGVNTRYSPYLNYDFGAEYFFGKGFNLMLELNGQNQGDKREDGTWVPNSDASYLTVGPGIGWSNDTVQTLLSYQRVLAGVNSDANDSVVLTAVFAF